MAEPFWLTEAELLLEARNRLDALIAARLQAGDVRDITVNECGRATRALAGRGATPVRPGRATPALAGPRPARTPAVADLFSAGRISHEHAYLIISCLKSLDPEWREAAQDELLSFAADHDPGLLAALIRAIKIRTGAEESAEARAQRQFDNRFLHLHDTYDGTVRLDGMLDPASAALLRAAIQPLLTPTGLINERTPGQQRADALLALAELSLKVHANPDLTQRAGITATPGVVVTTIDWTELRDGITTRQLPAATLNGTPITPATARMLACDAGIIPAVLRGKSEVLDLGRSTRTWTTAQRRAAALRDQRLRLARVPDRARTLRPAPPDPLGPRRTHRPPPQRLPVPVPPLARPPQKLDHHPQPRRQHRNPTAPKPASTKHFNTQQHATREAFARHLPTMKRAKVA